MTNVTQYCQSQTKRQPEAGYKFTTHHQCHAERSRSMIQLNVKRQNFFPISGCTTRARHPFNSWCTTRARHPFNSWCTTLLHCLFMAMRLSTTQKTQRYYGATTTTARETPFRCVGQALSSDVSICAFCLIIILL